MSYINKKKNQGVTHFPFSLSSGIRAVGVVYSEGNSPFGRSLFGVIFLMADFLSSGKFLPSEWTLNPLFVCFQRFCQVIVPRPEIDLFASTLNLQFSQVFCPLQGFSSLEGGRTLLPVVRPSIVCLPTLLDPPLSLGGDRSGRIGHYGSEASETMIPEVVIYSGGTSQSSPLLKDLCLPTLVSSTTFLWCNDILVTPFSDSLGQVADFLLFLFDKGLAFSSFRRLSLFDSLLL